MKFKITRTSDYFCSYYKNENPEKHIPCEGAYIDSCKPNKRYNGMFDVVYAIDINSTEDLLRLVETCGHKIIVGPAEKSGYPELEIYDDYRE